MASTPYSPISFNADEPLTDDKMNQLANNVQWVYENTPRVYYNAFGLKKAAGTKILAGVAIAPATQQIVSVATVYFGTFFSQGCNPIVVATPNSRNGRVRFATVTKGIGTAHPDHRGAELIVATMEPSATLNLHKVALPMNWIAIGW